MRKSELACRDNSKIPCERLFELVKKLFLVTISVEEYEQEADIKPTREEDDDDQGGREDGTQEDDFDDLENNKDMDTHRAAGQLSDKLSTPNVRQSSVRSKTVMAGCVEGSKENEGDEGEAVAQAPSEIAHLYSKSSMDVVCD
jgi:hypothetical protein